MLWRLVTKILVLIVQVPKGHVYIWFHAIPSTDLFLIFRLFNSTRASTAHENDCLRWRWINLQWFLYSYAPLTISKKEIEGLWTGYFQALFPETALLLISGRCPSKASGRESAFELGRIRVRVVLAYMYVHPSPSTNVCVYVYSSTQEPINTRISPLCSASKYFVLTM